MGTQYYTPCGVRSLRLWCPLACVPVSVTIGTRMWVTVVACPRLFKFCWVHRLPVCVKGLQVPSPGTPCLLAAPVWYALDFDIEFSEELVKGTRGALVNTASEHLARLPVPSVGENPFATSLFFDTAGVVKKLCARSLLFSNSKDPIRVLVKLQNGVILNLRKMRLTNDIVREVPSSVPAVLLTVHLYWQHCPQTPPPSAPHIPSIASSSIPLAKLAALGALGNRRLEDPTRWPEQISWEKCHLRASQRGKDPFTKEQDNLMMMTPILHKAFDGQGATHASVIIEPTEVILPSGGEANGSVSMRAYFQNHLLVEMTCFRPEALVEGEIRGDGPVSVTLTLSDPRPARFAAFLLFKAEYERQRASCADTAAAWCPPTTIPDSLEGLSALLTPGGYYFYLTLQGTRTYIAG